MASRPFLRSEHWVLLGALALGAALRLWFAVKAGSQPVTDFHWYYERGVEIASGMGYQVNGKPTAYWPVGFPAFLGLVFAVAGAGVAKAKAATILLSLTVVPLVYGLGEKLLRSPWAGAAGAAATAVYPPLVAYSGILASENLYIPLSLAGILAAVVAGRRRWIWLLAGLAFGAAVLVRPQAVLLPLIAVPLAWWNDGEEPKGFPLGWALGLTLLGLAVPVVPWLIRCQAVFGKPVFVSTNGGDNLLIGHHPGGNGRYVNPDLCGLDRGPDMGEVERDSAARKAAMANILRDPWEPVRTAPDKLAATFGPGMDAPYWAFQRTFGVLKPPGTGNDKGLYLAFREVNWWAQAAAVLLGTAAVLALAFQRSQDHPGTLIPLALLIFTSFVSVVFFGNPRFGLPMAPVFLLCGAELVLRAVRRWDPDSSRSGSKVGL